MNAGAAANREKAIPGYRDLRRLLGIGLTPRQIAIMRGKSTQAVYYQMARAKAAGILEEILAPNPTPTA